MPLTKEQQRELATLGRRANRRLERATPGQRAYLEHEIRKYHVRERITPAGEKMTVFQQGKAATQAEYKARINELRIFLGLKPARVDERGQPVYVTTSTRKGWEALKREQVRKAGETIRKGGSNITDEELAVILEEIDEGHKSAEFYKALANVEIAKRQSPEDWISVDRDRIIEAMKERREAQDRTDLLLSLRGR